MSFTPSYKDNETTQYSVHMHRSLRAPGPIRRFKLTCPDGFSVEVVDPVWRAVEWNDYHMTPQTRYQTHTPDESVYITLVVNDKDLLIDCADVCRFLQGKTTEYKFMNYETIGAQHTLADVQLEMEFVVTTPPSHGFL